jgi:hypothetical protein
MRTPDDDHVWKHIVSAAQRTGCTVQNQDEAHQQKITRLTTTTKMMMMTMRITVHSNSSSSGSKMSKEKEHALLFVTLFKETHAVHAEQGHGEWEKRGTCAGPVIVVQS